MKILTDQQLQDEIHRLDRMLSAKRLVQFNREQVARSAHQLCSWNDALRASEAALALEVIGPAGSDKRGRT